MFRITMAVAFLAGLMASTASAQPGFEWGEGTETETDGSKAIYARVSPAVLDQLVRNGLEVTEGTDGAAPMIRAGRPGARRVRLGGKTYTFRDNGVAEVNGQRVHVLKLTREFSYTGVWDTVDSSGTGCPLTLTQNGDQVTGTYSFPYDGMTIKGTVSGTIQDGVLTGRYSQNYPKPEFRAGAFKFEMSGDGTAFKGTWEDSNGKPAGKWNGTRAKGQTP